MLVYSFRCKECGVVQDVYVNNAGSVNMFLCEKCGSPDLVEITREVHKYVQTNNSYHDAEALSLSDQEK